jgi:uncharacterized damage-inducible protein DinB
MELARTTAEAYLRQAFTLMLDVAERLGDERVNRRPHGPQTNSVAALITHCCGVTDFWLGHVALNQPTDRDRDAEFTATATVTELRALVDATLRRVPGYLEAIDRGEANVDPAYCVGLPGDDASAGSVVVHVLEELYQHLGHMELTADALLA